MTSDPMSGLPTEAAPQPTEPPVPAAAVQTGRVLAERYRIGAKIGHGGMGSVWEAEHLSLGTTIAIKLIATDIAHGELARARFVREARSAAALQSPHVVQILDYGVDGALPYIAMERLQGEPLSRLLERDGPLSPHVLLTVVSHVSRALSKAHAMGIVHRDLKPDNIFVIRDEDGPRCKVLDFGIAKGLPGDPTDAQTHSGVMLGTPYYMSPEQARDASAAESASDLWSLGVIAFECLVGRRPFDGTSVATISVQILVDPIPVPSEHATVPPGFDAWFARATARDPSQRFASARELTSTLATALGLAAPMVTGTGEAMVPSPPLPPTRRVWPWVLPAFAVLCVATWAAVRGSGDTTAPTAAPAAKAAVPAPAPTPAPEPGPGPATKPPVAASPTPPSPPAIAEVALTLEGPAGAAVYLEDVLLGRLPDIIRVPRADTPLTLHIEARGYASLDWEVTPTADLRTTVPLVRRRKHNPPTDKPATPAPVHNVDDLEL